MKNVNEIICRNNPSTGKHIEAWPRLSGQPFYPNSWDSSWVRDDVSKQSDVEHLSWTFGLYMHAYTYEHICGLMPACTEHKKRHIQIKNTNN